MKKNNYSIKKDKNIRDALKYIELNELGLVFIEDRKKIIGVVTDGDIRRALIMKKNLETNLTSFMNKKFSLNDSSKVGSFTFPFFDKLLKNLLDNSLTYSLLQKKYFFPMCNFSFLKS